MKKNLGMLALIMAFWFPISFITTSFFLAYAIMSIPAGLLIDRFGEMPVLFC